MGSTIIQRVKLENFNEAIQNFQEGKVLRTNDN